MPTYEYECKKCGKRAEFFQRMSEAPKRRCPHCGAPSGLTRRIGCGAGIIFRGSGFYQTDYRSDSYRKQATKEKDSKDGGGKKEAPAADSAGTKPETKEPVKAAGA